MYIEGGPQCQVKCSTYAQECKVLHVKNIKACYCLDGWARISERGECYPSDIPECRSQWPRRFPF